MSREQDHKAYADKLIRSIKRQTRRKFNAEEKIRIVLAGLQGDAILEHRQKIKEKTIRLRKQLHQQKLVA